MSASDYLGLNKHKLFQNLREKLPRDCEKTQNVLAACDGVLYVWDFQDNCILTLNIKESKNKENEAVPHQILLSKTHVRFAVELLRVNQSNTLLAVCGPNGVLVLELPERCPPHGAFANNKEMIYCSRSHSLDERLFTCHPSVQVRQVRFHPASQNHDHIVILTSDNSLRLYEVANSTATSLGVYKVGQTPTGVMPGTKSFFLELLGETAVDFDFGPPELPDGRTSEESLFLNSYFGDSGLSTANRSSADVKDAKSRARKSLAEQFGSPNVTCPAQKENWRGLEWPIYILDSDGFVLMIKIDIHELKPARVKGPLPVMPQYENKYTNPACSLLCLPSTPPILCMGTINGTIFHSIVLPVDSNDDKMRIYKSTTDYSDSPDRALYVFEGITLELGLSAVEYKPEYTCPVFLHVDESRLGHYFATHEGGVHSVYVSALKTLQEYFKEPEDENLMAMIVEQPSSADYLVCTKMASSKNVNPVIGFAVYYDPTSVISLLKNGQVVSSLVISFTSLPCSEDLMPEDIENFNSPLKKMLSEPFDLQIQKILKPSSSQPILKMSSNDSGTQSQQECYELLQRAVQVFREDYFQHYEKAREEIEKRLKVLQMLKRYQTEQLKSLGAEKQVLQEKAEGLAEKYEDIRDKQEDLKKRCEKVLIRISRNKSEPSEAEKKFLKDLKSTQEKIEGYQKSINELRRQTKLQEKQMENWRKDIAKKETGLGSIQSEALRSNLQETTNKITKMINEITEYKKQLGLN